MLQQYYRPTIAEINLDALTQNIDFFRRRLPEGTQIMAVVKANAYGHGVIPVTKHLQSIGINYFAVAFIDEAIELRKGGINDPLLVLGFTPGRALEEAFAYDLTITIFTKETAEQINYLGQKLGRKLKVHIKVDTGMGRIGVSPSELGEFYSFIKALPWVKVEGVFTHFATADERDKSFTLRQEKVFYEALKAADITNEIPMIHLANSAAAIDLPKLQQNTVRLGIAMYGLLPSAEVGATYQELQPVMTMKTVIAYVKRILPGETVSYGATFRAQRETVVATLPIGYADGLSRNLSNKGSVLISGQEAPIIGRICMDQTMVDITDITEAKVGDEVVVFGKQLSAHLPLDKHAKLVKTINYELATLVGRRVPRIYLKNGLVFETTNII